MSSGMRPASKSATRHQSKPPPNSSASQTARTSRRSQNPFGFSTFGSVALPSGPKYAPARFSSRVMVDVPDRCMPSTISCIVERLLTVRRALDGRRYRIGGPGSRPALAKPGDFLRGVEVTDEARRVRTLDDGGGRAPGGQEARDTL